MVLDKMLKVMLRSISNDKKVTYVCIGTDRSVGDSLAPMVGTFISEKTRDIEIYGTLENPIHALNIYEKSSEYDLENKEIIIAIDASIFKEESTRQIGEIVFSNYGIKPGAGLNKELGTIGDYSIKGMVGTIQEFHVARLSVIMSMAKDIVDTIIEFEYQRNNCLIK